MPKGLLSCLCPDDRRRRRRPPNTDDSDAAKVFLLSTGTQLCKACSVIQLDDEALLRDHITYVQGNDGVSSPSLTIPKTSQFVNPFLRIELDYQVLDMFPDLPMMQQRAKDCDFCYMLRSEAISYGYEYRGFVSITLVYYWGHYSYPHLGLLALVAELSWRPDLPCDPPSSTPPFSYPQLLLFTPETDDATVASWLRIPRLRKKHVLCEENIEFMQNSIQRCCSSCIHPGFQSSSTFLPTRLLDIEDNTTDRSVNHRVRLVTTATSSRFNPEVPNQDEKVVYAALSYCWGSAADVTQQLRTEKCNLNDRTNNIPDDSMPRVIRDAIRVCRSVGIRYLWIDSLCIIQDDTADWERESAMMGQVFGHALVTIFATSSHSCHQSFLKRKRQRVVLPFLSGITSSVDGQFSLVRSGSYLATAERDPWGWPGTDLMQSVWSSRGWTHQEYLMSPRRLIFGHNWLHFECGNFMDTETGYFRELLDRDVSRNAPRSFHAILSHTNGLLPAELYQKWDDNVLHRYGRLKFTNELDKLPAISGLAKALSDVLCAYHASERSGRNYLAGLWKEDIKSSPFPLLWLIWHDLEKLSPCRDIELSELIGMLSKQDSYIAPSWSPMRLSGAHFSFQYRDWRVRPDDVVVSECDVIDAWTTPLSQENPFGRITDGALRIRGRFLYMLPSNIHQLLTYRHVPHVWFIADTGGREPEQALDSDSRLGLETPYYTNRIVAYLHIDWAPPYKGPKGEEESNAICIPREGLSMLLLGSTNGCESTRDRLLQQCSRGEPSPDTPMDAKPVVESSVNPGGVSGRDAWGLLLHPSTRGDGSYIRVGMWVSRAGDGTGMSYFEEIEDVREVLIV